MIEAVVDLLNPAETPESWNGALLTLADILRHRLVLNERLPQIVNFINQGLCNLFSKSGMIVRDASCFCIWSLAKAYNGPELTGSSFEQLCGNLLAITCLDRDIAVRRSAGAAF